MTETTATSSSVELQDHHMQKRFASLLLATVQLLAQAQPRAGSDTAPPAAQRAAVAPAAPVASVSTDELKSIETTLDDRFTQWSAAWSVDRYLRGSTRVLEHQFKGDTLLIRGSFSFTRWGQTNTIPFASSFKRSGRALSVTSLCYNDTTSGMTDCFESTAATAQSRQFMGAIIALGLLAALSAGSSSEDAGSSDRPSSRMCKQVPHCAPNWVDAYGNAVAGSCYYTEECY